MAGRRWTIEEYEWLKENYPKLGLKESAKYLNITEGAIENKCFEIKVPSIKHPWTQEEIQFLKENYPKYGYQGCSEKLNRTPVSIRVKASVLKIPKFILKPKDGYRFCARCHQEKLMSEFSKSKNKKFGLECYCKKCHNERSKIRKNKNRQYYWAHKSILSHSKKFIVKIKTKELENLAKQTIKCNFCKKDLGWNNIKFEDNSLTLDRLDNGNFLTLENVLIICRKCNTTKLNRSLEEFKDYMKDILPVIEDIIQQRKNHSS